MSLIVQKFGGSSVADLMRIQNVARIIADTKQQGHDIVVVVSAMYGETDRLIELAGSFSNASSREYDALISTGEQVSAALLSMALGAHHCSAHSYTAAQIGILTTSDHKKARIVDIDLSVLQQDISAGRIPVVAGFQGVSDMGAITTLGRGAPHFSTTSLSFPLKKH